MKSHNIFVNKIHDFPVYFIIRIDDIILVVKDIILVEIECEAQVKQVIKVFLRILFLFSHHIQWATRPTNSMVA